MYKHIVSPKKIFSQSKDTNNLHHILSALRFCSAGNAALAGIASRFGLTLEQLKSAIAAFEKGARRNV